MPFWDVFKKKPAPVMGTPAANDAVRAQLARMGDDGGAVRHVRHFAYPGAAADPDNREPILHALEAQGFTVEQAAGTDGFVLEHHRSVMPDDFDAVTAGLSAWFSERGWGYDGWECAVAQSSAQA